MHNNNSKLTSFFTITFTFTRWLWNVRGRRSGSNSRRKGSGSVRINDLWSWRAWRCGRRRFEILKILAIFFIANMHWTVSLESDLNRDRLANRVVSLANVRSQVVELNFGEDKRVLASDLKAIVFQWQNLVATPPSHEGLWITTSQTPQLRWLR